jgi:hypothetical protein
MSNNAHHFNNDRDSRYPAGAGSTPPRSFQKGSLWMKCFRHRIGVCAEIYFDLDLATANPSQTELIEAVVVQLSAAANHEGALNLPGLAGGRVFPAWNSVDRELEPEEALSPDSIEVRDTVAIERPM